MRTLDQIMIDIEVGDTPEYDEVKFTALVYKDLLCRTLQDVQNLLKNDCCELMKNFIRNDCCSRYKSALGVDPKTYIERESGIKLGSKNG